MTKTLPEMLVEMLVVGCAGLLLFGLAFALILKMTPFSIRKEIEQDQNTALAILIASVVLGVAIIVGAVVRG